MSRFVHHSSPSKKSRSRSSSSDGDFGDFDNASKEYLAYLNKRFPPPPPERKTVTLRPDGDPYRVLNHRYNCLQLIKKFVDDPAVEYDKSFFKCVKSNENSNSGENMDSNEECNIFEINEENRRKKIINYYNDKIVKDENKTILRYLKNNYYAEINETQNLKEYFIEYINTKSFFGAYLAYFEYYPKVLDILNNEIKVEVEKPNEYDYFINKYVTGFKKPGYPNLFTIEERNQFIYENIKKSVKESFEKSEKPITPNLYEEYKEVNKLDFASFGLVENNFDEIKFNEAFYRYKSISENEMDQTLYKSKPGYECNPEYCHMLPPYHYEALIKWLDPSAFAKRIDNFKSKTSNVFSNIVTFFGNKPPSGGKTRKSKMRKTRRMKKSGKRTRKARTL
jgi:hypothetical protein